MMRNDITLEALLNSLEDPIEKSASVTTTSKVEGVRSVAESLEGLLDKKASTETTSEEITNMNKQAQQTGKAIADAILGMIKQAEEGSNAVIQQTQELVSQQDDATELTPREGNTVTETLRDIVARGAAEGAVHPDHLALNAVSEEEDGYADVDMESSDEFDVENVESDLGKEAHEKLAAAVHLMESGFSFEDATDLVKEAAEEIEVEEFEHVKLATIHALVGEGLSVEDALDLTKEAMEILAKEAEEKPDTAIKAYGRQIGRSVVDGTVGGVAGAGLGAGVGALAGKAKKLKGLAAAGAMGGGYLGASAGSIRGQVKSLKNTQERARKEGAAKK